MFDFLSTFSFLNSQGGGSLVGIVFILIYVVGGIIAFFLGIYLIRRGFVNDSFIMVLIGILLTGFFLGIFIYYFSQNSITLIRERKKNFPSRKDKTT